MNPSECIVTFASSSVHCVGLGVLQEHKLDQEEKDEENVLNLLKIYYNN